MTSFWLEVHYNEKAFDVGVPDVDLMQVMDLIGDIAVDSIKQNVLIPDVYDMYYKNKKGNKMYIKSDMDLLSMFLTLEGNETIHVWLEDTINPIKEFRLYYDLRKRQEEKEREEEERARLERESVVIEPLCMEIPIVDVETNETHFHTIFISQELRDEPPPSPPSDTPQTNAKSPTAHPPSNTQIETELPQTQTTQQCPTSDRFSSQSTPLQTQGTQQNPPKKTPQPKKKMPKSTAIRKGISVSKANKSGVNEDGDNVGGSSEGGGSVRVNINYRATDANASVDNNSEDSEASIDDDFVFNEEDESDSESNEDIIETEDDVSESEVMRVPSHPFDATTIGDISEDERMEEDKIGECYLDKAYQNGQMYLPQRWGEITLKPWLMFMSKEEFLDVLSDYCVQQGLDLMIVKSDKTRYTGVCSGLECTWKIHASMLPDRMSWAIKVIAGDHKECFFNKKNSMATVAWMANKMRSELSAQPKMPVKAMVQWFRDKFAIEVCERTMYKVRIVVAEQVYGGHDKSYNLLAAYGEIVKMTNPGSHALITWCSPHNDNIIHFKAMFVAFDAWVKGFLRGCRPLIGVDGCHLKGRYKGVLLIAMALDGNNQIFCIAYAIVAKETTETWAYFFRNLKITFQQHGCIKWDWTFISDRMKGVESALEREFPLSSRRICAQHLYTNFKEKFSGPAYHDLFWRAANATSQSMYKKALESISKMSREAVTYLLNVPQQWSLQQFLPEVACSHNTSNYVESFNAVVTELREKPVLELMEGIRVWCMDKIAERLELAGNMGLAEPTPHARKQIEANCSESRHCTIVSAGGGEFEVIDGSYQFPVNVVIGFCACGEWQITGIPCKHACRAIYYNREEPMHYVHGFYLGECYKLTYQEHMHPIPDQHQWPTFNFPVVFPPIQERGIGRPAKNRKRKADEPRKGKRSTTLRCSICKTLGHNARSCQGGPTAKAKKLAAEAAAQKGKGVVGPSEKKKRKKRVVGDRVGAPSSQKKKGNNGAGPSCAS